ncbi:hypothetical protein EK904_003380 [Melospiza melodia maxima]|nr:hypothetical protein EK904_003380 [Melospiza melodia maxima]
MFLPFSWKPSLGCNVIPDSDVSPQKHYALRWPGQYLVEDKATSLLAVAAEFLIPELLALVQMFLSEEDERCLA